MAHPNARTWTLATLDRGGVYTLWFDREAFRWEVRAAGVTASAPLVTRPLPPRTRGALGRRRPAAEDGGAGDAAPATG